MNNESFFIAIKNNTLGSENWSKEILRITNNNELEKLNILLNEFQSFINKEKRIRDAGLPQYEAFRISISSELYGLMDPEFEACKHFESFLKQVIERKKIENIILPVSEISKNMDENIFRDDKAYSFFLALKEKIVKDKTQYADYSFIYNAMKQDNFLHRTSHLDFLEFLKRMNFSNIGDLYSQLKGGRTDAKKRSYSLIKQQFQ